MSGGHREAVRWGPRETGDLADAARLRSAIRNWNPSAVIHLAGSIAAGESVENPGKYYDNNLRGMLTLLEIMRETAVDRVVFSSSARSEEHTSELQSLMRISYAVFCLKKKKRKNKQYRAYNSIKTTRQI